jgi:hypothetical protein
MAYRRRSRKRTYYRTRRSTYRRPRRQRRNPRQSIGYRM